MKLFYGFALAFNMLTIIPFFKVHNFFAGVNGYSALFYPLVGTLLGTALWGFYTLFQGVIPEIHLCVIIFSLWVVLTGALHLDGLSDTIDGLFVKKENALEVMKDSHPGGMGVIFSFVFLLLKLSSLLYADAYALLPVILAYSRLNATLAIYLYPYTSHGIGELLKQELSLPMLLSSLGYVLILGYFFSFLSALIFSLLFVVAVAPLFVKRLGGLSGDIYGFIIEFSELLLLNFIIMRSAL